MFAVPLGAVNSSVAVVSEGVAPLTTIPAVADPIGPYAPSFLAVANEGFDPQEVPFHAEVVVVEPGPPHTCCLCSKTS